MRLFREAVYREAVYLDKHTVSAPMRQLNLFQHRAAVFYAVASGVLLTCAFDNIGAGFAAWFAIGFLMLGLRDAGPKHAFYLGLLAGFVHYATLLYWLVPTMRVYGPLPLGLAVGALLLLAFYLALYVSVFSVLLAAAVRRPLFLVVAAPVFWVALEYAKTFLFTGFPWGLVGYSQYAYLTLIQSADLFGVYGVSFFIVVINAAAFVIALHVLKLPWGTGGSGRAAARWEALLCAGIIVLAFSGNVLYGSTRMADVDARAAASGQIGVSVVQGNIEQAIKWDDAFISETIERYIRLSGETMTESPDLVVWPETAMPFYFLREKEYTDRVLEGLKRMDAWFLIGSPAYELEEGSGDFIFYNTAYLFDPKTRLAGAYDKVHLVPFGEYVPLGDRLPFVGRMVHSIGDFHPGEPGTVLSANKADLGVQICYEIIFPRYSARMVENGGNLIVNITNDAWFGETAGPVQHFSMTVFRAVENRKSLVRSANTGISAFVDPAGRILEQTRLNETAAIYREMPVMDGDRSFYTNYPGALPAFCILSSFLIVAAAAARRKRNKQGGQYHDNR